MTEPAEQPGHGRKFPPQKWERLVSPERHAFLDPAQVLDRLGIAAGMSVADVGAGPGFFTFPLAARVGPGGTVYATDVSPEMIEILEGRGVPPQVATSLSGESRIEIADAAADVAIVAFVLHEVVHPVAFLREVARVLRPGGRVAVLEWMPIEEEMGPPMHERMSGARVMELLESAGLTIGDEGELNASQYLVVGERESS